MNMTLTALVLTLLVSLTACIEHRPADTRIQKDTAEKVVEAPKKLRGLRVYEGQIPCVDCSGIYQHLVLKGDTAGIFRLTETYKNATEDGDETLVTNGVWKRYKTKRQQTPVTIFYLCEGSFKDSTREQRYAVGKDRITQLDINGQRIDSSFRYTLKLVKYVK